MKKSYININNKRQLILSEINNINDLSFKNKTPLKIRNNSTTFLTNINMKKTNPKIKNIKVNNIFKYIENNKPKYNSKINIINNFNYIKVPRQYNYNLKVVNGNNNNKIKIRRNLPTQELTDTTFDKKFELSKIMAKIRESKQKGKILKDKNIMNYKKLSEKLKINKNKRLLKQKYNNDDLFDYLKESNSFCGIKKNRLNFNCNTNSKNKLEKIKKYLSRNKSRNYINYIFQESTLDKLLKMKTELKTIKFVKKIKNKNYLKDK